MHPTEAGPIYGPIPSLEEIAVPITAPIEEGPGDLIPGLVPKAGQLVIAGETNVGKSLIALEVVSSLTTGLPLWGDKRLTPTDTVNKVIYLLGEHYNEIIQRLWRKTGLPMSENVWLLGPQQLAGDKWLISSGKANLPALEKLKKWCEGAGLIVFDPLAAFIAGVDVENDNTQMRAVLDQMSLIAGNSGAASLILAHQGKPMQDKFGGEHSRKKYAIRGASAIEDAATNIFYMNHIEKTRVYQLINRKYKGVAPDCFELLRSEETLTHTRS